MHTAAVLRWHAGQLVAVQGRYALRGIGMAQAAMAGAHSLQTLRHYPESDVVDATHHSQFYYHAHGSHRCPAQEHGHFHLFVRQGPGPAFFHLAALSLDAHGWPLRWFVTNRWVTGEQWVSATTAIAALPGFVVQARGRLAPVATWLTAMVALYAQPLASLLRRRDAIMARHLARTPAQDLFEDRRLDVITQSTLHLPTRLQQVASL
jgi:hypothetical protein